MAYEKRGALVTKGRKEGLGGEKENRLAAPFRRSGEVKKSYRWT